MKRREREREERGEVALGEGSCPIRPDVRNEVRVHNI